LGRLFLSTANAHIDVGAREFSSTSMGREKRFTFRPKVEQCSQVKTFNWKKFEKEPEKPSTPSIEALIKVVESLRIREEIKVHNQRNAKRRIRRKKFLELERKEIEANKSMRKMWQKKPKLNINPSWLLRARIKPKAPGISYRTTSSGSQAPL
jgi:HD-GYP domain-containing protein (c-di-GMP phosphodiesterase class II)